MLTLDYYIDLLVLYLETYVLNIVFYLFGYRIYEIKPENKNFEKFILISYKTKTEFKEKTKINVKKITDGLFFEVRSLNDGI